MELDIWWDTYAFNDGAQLEYSTDAGATWTLLGRHQYRKLVHYLWIFSWM